jgi:hypothetical protein
VARVDFMGLWILYILGSSKLHGIVGSLYSWVDYTS